LSCAETAKLVRVALAKTFPDIKFSVRSRTYSGGASIDVAWTDGPTITRVQPILDSYEGKSFDGSIDMGCYNDHYLLPDGSVTFAHTSGTEGSMGWIPAVDAPRPIRGERVHFGANYVFGHRAISGEAGLLVHAERYIREHCACEDNRFGNQWVSDLAIQLVYAIDYTEPVSWLARFERAFHRAICHEEPEEEVSNERAQA
jgi:hypothetical protein